MRKRKLLTLIGSVCLILVLAAMPFMGACAPEEVVTPPGEGEEAPPPEEKPPPVTELKLLGSSVGGGTFLRYSYLAEVTSEELGIPVSCLPGSAKANARLLGNGEGDVAYAPLSFFFHALKGTGPIEEPIPNLRWMGCFSVGMFFCAVRADSDIYTFEDLIGKTVAFGPEGTQCEMAPPIILEACGITEEDIEAGGGVVSRISVEEQRMRLLDGTVDAIWYMWTAGAGSCSMLVEAEERYGVRILGLSEEIIDELIEASPSWTRGEIEGGVLKAHPEPVPLVGVPVLDICRAELPEETVYQLLKAWYKPDVIKEVRARFAEFPSFGDKEQGITGITACPVHPGAAKFWKEYRGSLPPGVTVPD